MYPLEKFIDYRGYRVLWRTGDVSRICLCVVGIAVGIEGEANTAVKVVRIFLLGRKECAVYSIEVILRRN